jgi:hypothetical protein
MQISYEVDGVWIYIFTLTIRGIFPICQLHSDGHYQEKTSGKLASHCCDEFEDFVFLFEILISVIF